jgi:hypothetical protein
MPTKSEENKPVIQHIDDALGRGDTDALFASTHKGDPAERDRRIARFLAKLMVGDMYWLCFFVLCGGVSLGFGTWASSKIRSFEVSHTAETDGKRGLCYRYRTAR